MTNPLSLEQVLLPCPNPWCGSSEIIRISALDHAGYVEGEFRVVSQFENNGG